MASKNVGSAIPRRLARSTVVLMLALGLFGSVAPVDAHPAGSHAHWSRTCSASYTVRTHAYAYYWQTHTLGATSWWSGNYSNPNQQWRNKIWWGYSDGSGEIHASKISSYYTSCYNVS